MKKGILFLVTFVLIVSIMQITVFGEITNQFSAKYEYKQDLFSDIKGNEWYANNVQRCYELGLMMGKKDDFFDANGKVTIAEAIYMASRTHEIYYGGDGVIENTGNAWYDGAVSYAVNNGIIKLGDFSNYNLYATREQLAYIFASILPKSEYIILNNIQSIPDLDVVGPYDASIYYLYRVGILTGNDEFGTFNRDSYMTRAEVAVLLIRIVSPENRIIFGKDAVIYDGNNPNYSKYDFKYAINGYEGETKENIDINKINIYGTEFINEIKTVDLPKNAEMYPYIVSGIDNNIYEIPNFVSDSSDSYGPIKAYERYFEEYASMGNMISSAYNEMLNIDYETISQDYFRNSIYYALWYRSVEYQLTDYIDYVKKNKIKIEGKATPLFPIVYYDGYQLRVRTKIEYTILSSDTKIDLIFGDRNGNPGASREFYAPTEYVSLHKTMYVDIPFGFALDYQENKLVLRLDDYLPLSKRQAGQFSVEGKEL